MLLYGRAHVFYPPSKLVNQLCLLFLQGLVDPSRVAELAMRLSDMGCYEVSLGDTTGVATPASTLKVLQVVSLATLRSFSIRCKAEALRCLVSLTISDKGCWRVA